MCAVVEGKKMRKKCFSNNNDDEMYVRVLTFHMNLLDSACLKI